MNALASKIVSDRSFRDEFFNDPAGTAERMGIKLTDDQLSRLKRMDRKEFDRLADEAAGTQSLGGVWAA